MTHIHCDKKVDSIFLDKLFHRYLQAKRELGKYAAAIAQHTGVPYKRAMKKMKEVVMFETKLAKVGYG